ncbi:MAG TPA: ATP-binding cassette domain-containing protein [Chlamydiales bacterium]|nr:ATP-binding cassette domain-containing protein [Chlamydiales bacterium]
MDLVLLKNISKKFGKITALEGINGALEKGKITALAGPDGSGKTTLIRLIAALLLPTTGEITVQGYNTIKEAEKIHDLLGYMPQRFGLYEDLTVIQNLDLYADLKGVKEEEKKGIFDRLLSFTGLAPFIHRLAKDLSGGMKQKLGLACTLLSKPTLLLLDEPTVGVDPISRRELWKMIQDLLQEGITVLWSTAYLEEAEKCDGVILLNEGKLIYHGPPHELTKRKEGLTFRVKPTGNKRKFLEKITERKDVVDAVIQGSNVRIVLKEGGAPGSDWTPTPPRFEDAFIDILGGCPKGGSKLAANAPEMHPQREYMITTHDLTKRFGDFTAADKINLQIKPKEVFGLLGPNGAGKTTTFKMMCGLLPPTSGTATVEGVDLLTASAKAREHIGYMAQKFSLYGGLSVLQNLRFFAGVYHADEKVISEMIETFNFTPFLDLSAGLLPLGYKQRLALACALMHRPEVIFLDEPTSGVDPITRREFWEHINGLVEKGITVMVTTHFMDEAEYCDRIGLIYQSKLITVGTPDELKEKARTPDNQNPTLEDAFIHLIETYDKERDHVVAKG